MSQSIQKQIGLLPTIEAEGHLVQVSREMLSANLVPASYNAALQERKCRLYRIGMHISAHVHPISVLNRFVLGCL
jgi:hypothetical protein